MFPLPPPWRQLFALLAFASLAPLGCVRSPCERDDGQAISYEGGQTDASGTYYETSPPKGPWLRFTSGTRLKLKHRLRATPRDWQAYLSFEEYPQQIAENAGSQVAVEFSDNGEYIEIINDTCGDFFIRFTAWLSPLDPLADEDAGNVSFRSDAGQTTPAPSDAGQTTPAPSDAGQTTPAPSDAG